MKLQTIKSAIATLDVRSAKPPPKAADPTYLSAAYREWRETVIARASRRCEAVADGRRCEKAEPRHRLFADHIVEIKDGGSRFDPANGRCLCGAHHSVKTAQARARRR